MDRTKPDFKKYIDGALKRLPAIEQHGDNRITIDCSPFRVISGIYSIAITDINPSAKIHPEGKLCTIIALVFEKKILAEKQLIWSLIELIPEI